MTIFVYFDIFDYNIMESLGYFFSSFLNMLGFTSEPSTDSLKKPDSKSINSSSSLKENDDNKEKESKTSEKKEDSEETFTFIDVFENEEEIEDIVHDIFITNF